MSFKLDAPYDINPDRPIFRGRRERHQLFDNGEIRIFGRDYSGKVHLVAFTETHQVWHKHASQCFSGLGTQIYVRPWYVLVKIHLNEVQQTLAEEIEGREVDVETSRSYKKHLLERLAETGPVEIPGKTNGKR